MKKVVLSLLAFGLIGTGAFADGPTVTIGDWGRQITAAGNSASGYWINTGASWGGAPRIVGLNIQAKTDNAGFSITPSADGGVFGLTDQNKAWISPLAGLTVESGLSLETDTWRGIHDFGNWNWLRMGQAHGDGITFSRIGAGGYDTAVEYNKDGIGGWGLIHFGGAGFDKTAADGSSVAPAGTTAIGASLQLGGAYTIAGVGQIKAQYLGYASGAELTDTVFGVDSTKKNGDPYGTYQVAFNISAVQNLAFEIGVQLPSVSKAAGYAYSVNAIGGYTMDKTTINFQVLSTSYTDDTAGKAGLGLGGGIGLDYDLGDSVGVSGDVRYNNGLAASKGLDDGADTFTGITIGVTKGFSNGLIGIGFEYVTKGSKYNFGATDSTKGGWAIPVRLEEWF